MIYKLQCIYEEGNQKESTKIVDIDCSNNEENDEEETIVISSKVVDHQNNNLYL